MPDPDWAFVSICESDPVENINSVNVISTEFLVETTNLVIHPTVSFYIVMPTPDDSGC